MSFRQVDLFIETALALSKTGFQIAELAAVCWVFRLRAITCDSGSPARPLLPCWVGIPGDFVRSPDLAIFNLA